MLPRTTSNDLPAPRVMTLRASRLMLSLSTLALAAACGGGGEGEGGTEISAASVAAISADSGGSGTFGSYFMASITDEWRAAAANIRNNVARYRVQNGRFTVNGSSISANPLFSSRADYAHAVGLSGQGQVIAIVDEGFRQTHETLAGKTTSVTGDPGVADHGTMVASVAAGNSDTMVGVAPGADLAYGSYDTYESLTAAANDATLRGAVVQNNSWGFTDSPATQATYNSIFNNSSGQAWLTALRTYAQNGIVVFAISNDNDATTAGIMEALPVYVSSLERSWIAVGNVVPVYDDSGVNAVGFRASAACLEAARWCMVADGYWYGATAGSNSAYGEGAGTSFAAPSVSGALALLAEAFPNLTAQQLRARLLASADNTFDGFVAAGTVDLLEGSGTYNHSYSTEYGHGFLDIRAALLPIGTTAVATADGGSIETKDYAFSTGGAMGDAVSRGLEGVDLVVSDSFGGGFDVAAKEFAHQADVGSLVETVAARSFSKDYRASRTARLNPLSDTFAAHRGETIELNTPDGRARASILMAGEDNYGLAVSRSLTDGDLRIDVGVKVARNDGSVMGFQDASGAGGATMAAVTLGLSHDLGTGGFFALSGELGVADLDTPTAFSGVSSAGFNSVRLDVGSRGVFNAGDRIAFGVSMPVAVTSGSASIDAPVSMGEGRSEIRSLDLDLAPEARQMDLSISYQMPMSDTSELMLELVHAQNYGNVAGLSDTAAVIGVKWAF